MEMEEYCWYLKFLRFIYMLYILNCMLLFNCVGINLYNLLFYDCFFI